MNSRFLGKFSIIVLAAVWLLPSLSAATMKPMVAGKRGVVAAGHPLVAEAGLRILEKGGNAVDAGVATVFAASVVEMNGFGAGAECPILLKLADKPLAAINARASPCLHSGAIRCQYLASRDSNSRGKSQSATEVDNLYTQ